jgi:cyclic pyranopterin phosphate synthase
MTASEFSHLDDRGQLRMVDVGGKQPTVRTAVAAGEVRMSPQLVARLRRGEIEKGNVLAAAHTAGVLGAKRTAELIPLCHPLALDHIDLRVKVVARGVEITAAIKLTGRTGAEMEALTAVAVAALTIYDMCKAVDREMVIGEIRLIEKTGGRSGHFKRGARGSGHRGAAAPGPVAQPPRARARTPRRRGKATE